MKLSCFPYTPDIDVMLRHKNMMMDDSICSIISFKEDTTQLQELQQKTGILCTDLIEVGLAKADALLLLNNDRKLRWDKYYKCIDYAVEHNMPVYASQSLITEIPDDSFKIDLINMEKIYIPQLKYLDERLFTIEIPIVVVMGMGENCGKFECQLELKEQFDERGYSSRWLGTNALGSRMGMHSLPNFLFDPNISFPRKVLEFNRYVYDFCVAFSPDILVIGIPSGITSIGEKDTNYFAEIPLVIANALHVDYGLLAFYYRTNVHDEFLDRLKRYCLNQYRICVPIFYMSRQMLVREQDGVKMRQLFLSDEYITKYPSNLSLENNVAVPQKDNRKVFEILIRYLQGNIETV